MTTWTCPLCPYSHTSEDILPAVVKHATSEHPAYLEESATVADMLDQIPALLREAALTVDAPNPSGPKLQFLGGSVDVKDWTHTRKGAKPQHGATRDEQVPGGLEDDRWSPTSRTIALFMELNPTSENSLFDGLGICSRIIWENLDDDTKRAHPQPLGTPYWSTEIAWLSKVWPDSQAYLDKCDIDWIRDEVRSIWLAIASYAGVRRKPKYRCPTEGCKEQMHLSEGDWMTCSAGHQHPGPGRLSREWRRKPPMSTKDLSKALRIPEGTIWRWRHEKKIKPCREEGRTLFWLPWDLITQRYPDLVAEIDKETAA